MHPYKGKPDYQFWKRAPGIARSVDLDPVTDPPFRLSRQDRIVTAGSCFAQHLSKRLVAHGFNHLVTEEPHPLIPPDEHAAYGYGIFSARYGNIYTARQLRQLLLRSYGGFLPIETSWRREDGRLVDPFRPAIVERGYPGLGELLADREIHLAAVRKAVESATFLVFTLGLTEAWIDRRDGAVFPLAPGVAGGSFDDKIHAFVNFDADETVADLLHAIDFMRVRNPGLRLILTVSPVPLNATAVPRHVLVSTTYSKSVLRVAAEKVMSAMEGVAYFPAYEIITSPHARGRYFGPDCRSVTEAGVDHVMSVFLRHYAEDSGTPMREIPSDAARKREQSERHLRAMQDVMDVVCDEERIAPN